jgi:hypothetical protein
MRHAVLALALVALATPVLSGGLTVYRCTDDAGRVALRDSPCPAGQREQAIDMKRPVNPPPAPVVQAQAPPQPVPPPAGTRIVIVEPPRPLYECTTPDGERYTSDDAAGNPRWVPLWTLGYPATWRRNPLGDRVGAPPPKPPRDGPGAPELHPAIGLAYTPGAWVRDRCVELPRAEACAMLRAQQRALRTQWFDAMPTRRAEITQEERRLRDRVARMCPPGG